MLHRADPSRRVPVYLQAHTKENLIWQLKLSAVILLGYIAYEEYMTRKNLRDFKRTLNATEIEH